MTRTQNEANSDQPKNSGTRREPKKISWYSGLLRWTKKIFAIIQDIISFLGELAQHALHLLTFTFSVAVKIGVNPVAPIVCSIILFLLVVAVTVDQWWKIGVWLARAFGAPTATGAIAGLLFGIGINIFQLTPKLRKLSRGINRAYARLGINPDYESSDSDDPQQLERNWFNENHRKSKVWSAISYCVETGLVVVYVFAAQAGAVLAIFQALISLCLPEKTLDLVSNTISLMGAVSRQVAYDEPPESKVNL